jgi:hypothetical protein
MHVQYFIKSNQITNKHTNKVEAQDELSQTRNDLKRVLLGHQREPGENCDAKGARECTLPVSTTSASPSWPTHSNAEVSRATATSRYGTRTRATHSSCRGTYLP